MINSDLLTHLEAYRDSFNQRQKAVNNLISSFQAFNKTQKALREKADPNTSVVEQFSQSLTALNEMALKENAIDPLMPELRRDAKQLSQIAGALKDAHTALRGESVDVVKLDKAYKALQAAKVDDATFRDMVAALADEFTEAQRQLGNTFGAALRDAFAVQGIEVAGRPPHIEAGRYEIALNITKRRAVLQYGKEIVANSVLSVESIWSAYQRAEKDLTQRKEDPSAWMRQLYEAWEAAQQGRGADRRANIVECYFEMVLLRQKKQFRASPTKSAFVDYSRAQFAYDLDQYVNRSQIAHKGLRPELHVAIKANTDNPEKSLWVVEGHGPHDGRYIGDLVFDKRD